MDAVALYARLDADFEFAYPKPPWHAVRRMAALIAPGDEVAYVDMRLEEAGRGLVDGAVLVVTERLFVHARLAGSPTRLDGDEGPASTVHVAVWARTKLERLAIHEDEAGVANSDSTWDDDWGNRWPVGASVALHFEGQVDPIVLPLAPKPNKAHRESLFTTVEAFTAEL